MTFQAQQNLASVKQGLMSLGYEDDLIVHDYEFSSILSDEHTLQKADIVAFGGQPFSTRTACIGVHFGEPKEVIDFAELGAPIIISLSKIEDIASFWTYDSEGNQKHIHTVENNKIVQFLSGKEEWAPESILRAKSIDIYHKDSRLDLYDFGLIPGLEKKIQEKLSQLLGDTVEEIKSLQNNGDDLVDESQYRSIFRILFRLMAAKLLNDRSFPGEWNDRNVELVLERIEKFYFKGIAIPKIDLRLNVKQAAWDKIRNGFHFQNLSLESLAYVYENTFVNKDTRKKYSTYATSPSIAEYMIGNLPIERLSPEDRNIFEPFCGHAPFLVSAFGRLRSLLPLDMEMDDRHQYLSSKIKGMELDSFAIEVARYSLVLADYPNPSGWKIINDDFFHSEDTPIMLDEANIVLLNPPYSKFVDNEENKSKNLTGSMGSKAISIVLENPPKMLGFIVSKAFLYGRSFKKIREKLIESYSDIQILSLPDNAFKHAELETVAVTAYGSSESMIRTIMRSEISKDDFPAFEEYGKITWSSKREFRHRELITLWEAPLISELQESLRHLPILSNYVEIHRGVEYNDTKSSILVSLKEEKDGNKLKFVPGMAYVDKYYQPYKIVSHQYLNADTNKMRRGAKILPEKWSTKPKIIINAHGISRGLWRIFADVDEIGLMCYQNFSAMWPKPGVNLYFIAALLNNPIANILISSKEPKGWSNPITSIVETPVPILPEEDKIEIENIVKQYLDSFAPDTYKSAYVAFEYRRKMLLKIDEKIIKAYGLSDELKDRLLKAFIYPKKISFDEFDGDLQERRSELIDRYFEGKIDFGEIRSLNYIDYFMRDIREAIYSPVIERLRSLNNSELTEYKEKD